ncbi:MAG: hypothetical protein CO093_01780 [Alphaproteobacteria bacterium CG_4_9_14_3_um_filter_47_13]|nr:MAG: hypothetical protein CO093_01780 [Alphaproteobacteria bacterium CG_4_9_14_3_um_filter_47_13]
MRRIILGTVALLAISFPAQAQNKEALCQLLPAGQTVPGVNYVPGVDVHGNAVVPADTNRLIREHVDVIRIPVQMDLAWNLQQQLPQGTKLDATLAMIDIYKGGRVEISGMDVTEAAYTLCGKQQPVIKEEKKMTPAQSPQSLQPQTQKQEPENGITWSREY